MAGFGEGFGVASHGAYLIWTGGGDDVAATEEERRRYLKFRAAGGSTGVGAGGHGIHVRPGVDHVEGTVKDVIGPSTTASTSSRSTSSSSSTAR